MIAARTFKATKPALTESQEQALLFEWAEAESERTPELAELFHVPNGGHRNKTVAAKLKREGVKAGIPDIFLLVPRNGHHGLIIELKAKGRGPTRAQEGWLERFGRRGYLALVCHGFEDAKGTILDYLNKKLTRCRGTQKLPGGMKP